MPPKETNKKYQWNFRKTPCHIYVYVCILCIYIICICIVYIHIFMYIHMYMSYIYSYLYIHIFMYIHMYMYYIHTHIYVYTYVWPPSQFFHRNPRRFLHCFEPKKPMSSLACAPSSSHAAASASISWWRMLMAIDDRCELILLLDLSYLIIDDRLYIYTDELIDDR